MRIVSIIVQIGSMPLAVALVTAPSVARACATCFGAADDPTSKAILYAVFGLVGVTSGVLGGFATFFVYLAKKARAAQAKDTQPASR